MVNVNGENMAEYLGRQEERGSSQAEEAGSKGCKAGGERPREQKEHSGQ